MNHLTFQRIPTKLKALAIVLMVLAITIFNFPGVALAGSAVPNP